MNRLRRAYVDLDPGIERYLITSTTDDGAGIGRTDTMGPDRDVSQVLASARWAIALGVVAGLAFLTAGLLVGYRMYMRSEADPDTVRFPTLT